NAAASGFNLCRTTNIAQVNTAATSRDLHLPVALAHLHTAAAGLNGRALCPRLNLNAAPTRFCHDFPVGMPNLNGAAASVQTEIATNGAYIDRSAAGFGARSSADVIQLHGAAAALR